MISYPNGPLVLSDNEKDMLRQLGHTKKQGGKYLYAVKSFDTNPHYYSVYSGEEDKSKRHFVANVYGNIVLCLNWILHEDLTIGKTVFNIDELLEQYCN